MSIVYDAAARTAYCEQVVKSHVTKRAATVEHKRLTLAPLYEPERKDAHGEATSASALEEAVVEFAKNGDKRLLLQHGELGEHYVGTILSVFQWPYEATVPMTDPATGKVTKHRFAPDTAWCWIQWDEGEAWSCVLNGTLRGLSMGGRATRVPDPSVAKLAHMGYDIRKNVLNADDLRQCIAIAEEIIQRDPEAARERGIAKSDSGVLIAYEDLGVVHITPTRLELLREAEE